MQTLIRSVVLASALMAALIEAYLATIQLYSSLFWFSIALAIGVFAIGYRARTAGLPIAMMAMYLMPAVYLRWLGRGGEHFGLEIIWILPLLGLIASGRGALTWSLPRTWQWPLVTWALVVSVSWPIVFLRELDFYPGILPLGGIANSSIGGTPWDTGLNVTYFALGHLVGILWIDALFRWFRREPFLVFASRVVMPLAFAAAIASSVALYQGFVDLSFLNTRFWAYMLRASGTLGDPNKFGMIAAFWAIGSVALGRRLPTPWSWIVSLGGFFLAFAGVWITGTRTGLAALMIATVFLAIEAVRDWRARAAAGGPARSLTKPVIAGAVIAAALALALTQAGTHTVIGRGVLTLLPFGEVGVIKGLNRLLWERDGYGPAAIQMVREHPAAGVGVGSFHTLVHDYGRPLGYDIPTDNAQAWIRHQVAELGLIGSIPSIWWCIVFAQLLFSPPRAGGDRFTAGALRGILIGFAVASLFGMAGQSMAVIITFWTFAFWFAQARDHHAGSKDPEPQQGVGRGAGSSGPAAITAVLVLLHAGVTMVDAKGELRPVNRAQRFDWPYSYGLRSLEDDPGGNPAGRRWTLERSAVVVPVKGKVLKFVAWIDHPDADERPVPVKVWADSKLVYSGDLKRSAVISLDIPASPGEKNIVIKTWIGRLWRPADSGRGDDRELGLSIRDWVWE